VCTIAAGQRCTPGAAACCANGGVCQGQSGQEVCQIPEIDPNAQCTGGGSCTGWYGFKCTNLNADGQCLDNGQRFTSRSSAESYAGACGQVDQVCVGGTKDGQLCGDFTIYNQCGGGGGEPTPPPTTTVGPMCMKVTMKVNGTNATEGTTIKLGDSLQFVCGQVTGISNYDFRVVEPGGIKKRLTATGATSQAYVVSKVGDFKAQCRLCTGPDRSQCQPFEEIN
jgi:hypothetical protein